MSNQKLLIIYSINFQKLAMKRFGSKDVQQFDNNFLQIGVYFGHLDTKFITESPKYTVNVISFGNVIDT